jgi:hypothetical protein
VRRAGDYFAQSVDWFSFGDMKGTIGNRGNDW